MTRAPASVQLTSGPLRFFAAAVVLCAALLAASHIGGQMAPAFVGAPADTEGFFRLNGQYPGDPLREAPDVRVWGSWAGSDDNQGSLTLGPFPAPERLSIGVGGYPRHAGNGIFLQLAGTADRREFKPSTDVGERWQIFDVPVPPEWIGRPIELVAVDHATGPTGWLSLTEPLRGGIVLGLHQIVSALAAWAVNGVVYGLLYAAALRVVAGRVRVARWWLPLVASAVVATCGYAAFWLYFAHATAGKVGGIALLAVAAFLALRPRARPLAPSDDVHRIGFLLLAIGFFYVAVLYQYPSAAEPYRLASSRFLPGLPGDNTLPHNTAASLYHGWSLLDSGADWKSSDRPPLQAGCLLLTWRVDHALGIDERLGSMTSAIWLQLLWVAAGYGLLRTLGVAAARATGWTVVIAFTGFFIQNTVYTWPKLAAAAFACGAFALWVLPERSLQVGSRRAYLAGAWLLALAWLAHGGIAFAVLPLLPWIGWRLLRGEARGWILAGVMFLLFAAPWTAYQRFYDPPGNRLLKWHLAGHLQKDSIGTWQAIRDGYRALSWHEIVERRVENFATQAGEGWAAAVSFTRSTAGDRRNGQFFHLLQTLNWWLVGVPIAVLLAVRRRFTRAMALLSLWVFATLVVWCLLIFQGGQAILHQGSYTMPLVACAVLAAVLDTLGAWALGVMALIHAAVFVTTWLGSNEVVAGPPTGLPFVAIGGVALFVLICRRDRPESGDNGTVGGALRPDSAAPRQSIRA